MKRYKLIVISFLMTSMMLYSCLDLNPRDQLAETNMWTSAREYELFANQFYSWTRDFSTAVSDNSDKPLHSDYCSDLMVTANNNPYNNGTFTIPATDANYTDAYKHIRSTNMLLQNAEKFDTPKDIEQYVGEAKFFRAYSYFDLVQLYGDAIIVKKPLSLEDKELQIARNNREEVIDFIIEDLEEAVNLLPAHANMGVEENGRISREGCWAFLSRVALYEGTWLKFRNNSENTERSKMLLDKAAKAAKEVMKSGQFSLFQPAALGVTAQKYMFILEDTKSNPAGIQKSANKEFIFARRHDETLRPISSGGITHASLCNVMYISRKFATMYLCQNGLPIRYSGQDNPLFEGYQKIDSEFANRDNRMRYTLAKPHDYFWNHDKSRTTWTGDESERKSAAIQDFIPKTGTGYHNQKWATERKVKSGYEGYDYPIIRYAEVLLNYAEAVFERDDKISNDELNESLNLVRKRVNPDASMKNLTNELVNDNGLSMREEIRRERTIELYLEGFRLDDLKRWNTFVREMNEPVLGIKWTGTEYETAWSACLYPPTGEGYIIVNNNRKWSAKHELYPLPLDQLRLNPNLKQNPGW